MAENELEKPKQALVIVAALVAIAVVLLLLPTLIKAIGSSDRPVDEITADVTSDVDSKESEVVESPVAAQPPSPAPAPTPVAESPWADKQRQQSRADTQGVLSDLLAEIQGLEALQAETWAPDDLERIQGLAADGDSQYETMSYDAAIGIYKEALGEAQALSESAPEAAGRYLDEGAVALESNQIMTAVSKLELATLLDPSSDEIASLLARAKVREQVMMLDSAAENFLREDALESAREKYAAIQSLDSAYTDIDQKIQNVDNLIVERDYRKAMSNGFKNLAEGKLDAAEAAFKKAGTIKSANDAVDEALQQVESAKINNIRQRKLDRAIVLEADEQWAEALSIYTKLLQEDNTLTSATLGKIRSQVRADLDARIRKILEDPLKLQNDQPWKEANSVLADAREVADRGAKLSSQIDQLEMIVRRARTKVTLALFSDSVTNVEIYRLGNLGQFSEHAVALYPGRYVVVGKRSGCRDVREDLVIDGTEPRIELNIQCRETI